MRSSIIFALGLMSVPGLTPSAEAGECYQTDLVTSWYVRYLGRYPDFPGASGWVRALKHGAAPIQMEAGILASDEYYHRHGCSPRGFVHGLYEDILGRCPNGREIDYWASQLGRCGCRKTVALQFLQAARSAPPPPVYAPVEPVPAFRPYYVPAQPAHHQGFPIHR